MVVKGILIDLGDTLMFVDEKKNRKYMEGLLSILNKYGNTCSVDDLAVHLGNLYYGSSRGEFKNYDEYWKSLLTNLKLPCARAMELSIARLDVQASGKVQFN